MITIAREGLEDKYSLQLNPGEGPGRRGGRPWERRASVANGLASRLRSWGQGEATGVCVGCVGCVLVPVERDLARNPGKGRGLDSVGAVESEASLRIRFYWDGKGGDKVGALPKARPGGVVRSLATSTLLPSREALPVLDAPLAL